MLRNMPDAKPKVLLIEDDQFMATLLSEALGKDGFDVALAEDGEDAVRRFPEVRPDLLLVDILLAKKSGLAALREIRSLPGGAGVPAIMLSNLEDPAYVREAEELGVKAYLIKANTQLSEIVAKAREVLQK